MRNKRGGTCWRCKKWVEPDQGNLTGGNGLRFYLEHAVPCVEISMDERERIRRQLDSIRPARGHEYDGDGEAP